MQPITAQILPMVTVSTQSDVFIDSYLNTPLPKVKTGCGPTDFIADQEEEDKISCVKQGEYYGHPCPIRAEVHNDPRQCVWRSRYEPSDDVYTAPMVGAPSSTNGIIEYAFDHFGGQLRGNLITSVYQGPLLRVIMKPNGEEVIPESNPPLLLVNQRDSTAVGSDGLDVTQAPNGNLIEARLSVSSLYVHKPSEEPTSEMSVKGVFPSRGGLFGGSVLDVAGVNFSSSATVTVGGASCPVLSTTSTTIECTLPPGSEGLVDVVVTQGTTKSTFARGYRYITGVPAGQPPASPPPTQSPTM